MAFSIPNRPFATEPITGLMIPDGIFEASIGKQTINAHIRNTGAVEPNIQVYIESISDPGIIVTPATIPLGNMQGNVSYLFSWDADFTAATPGKHLISFIIETPTGDVRIIKKIFVTKLGYDPEDKSFTATTPEGILRLTVNKIVPQRTRICCPRQPGENQCPCPEREDLSSVTRDPLTGEPSYRVTTINVFDYLRGFKGHDPRFEFCLPGYLLQDITVAITPTPPYEGQYGDLPYQDPWWKAILCILAFLLILAASLIESRRGEGEVTETIEPGSPSDSDEDCVSCGVEASGGGTSYVAAALVAAAAALATIAGLYDQRDPFRKGADHTAPGAGEITLTEKLHVSFNYADSINPGKPFAVGADWKYTRQTDVKTYTYEASEVNKNIHTISKYKITAPDTVRVYKKEYFTIMASFFKDNDHVLRGDQLFVQCFLLGPRGQWKKIILQDNGARTNADAKANDGIYTGRHFFGRNDQGMWKYFVIAQDVNNAQPDMKPEEAAQIIGGIVLTNQLVLSFDGGECAFVPDGHINIIAP